MRREWATSQNLPKSPVLKKSSQLRGAVETNPARATQPAHWSCGSNKIRSNHMNESDRHQLRRAIRLAMNGRGRVEPNPMVGCVIVKDGRVIGEGYHQQFGGPHAEPNALA